MKLKWTQQTELLILIVRVRTSLSLKAILWIALATKRLFLTIYWAPDSTVILVLAVRDTTPAARDSLLLYDPDCNDSKPYNLY